MPKITLTSKSFFCIQRVPQRQNFCYIVNKIPSTLLHFHVSSKAGDDSEAAHWTSQVDGSSHQESDKANCKEDFQSLKTKTDHI